MRLVVLIGVLGCGGSEGVGESCGAMALPFTGGPNAVSILSAKLECNSTSVSPLVTVRHATPSELDGVQQTVGVFPDRDCSGAPVEATDNVISDLEESFAEVIQRSINPTLYDEICGSSEWPLSVRFGTQTAFPTTVGIVPATVITAP